MAAHPFSTVKWYLDCVTESGETAILYCATIHWRGIKMATGSLLTSHESHTETRSSLGAYHLSEECSEIRVEHPALHASGRWVADSSPVKRIVYEGPRGCVTWNCLQPRSRVSLRTRDREITGLGYAECLTLTLPPWHLPLRKLRWGRFVAEHDSLAWVDWQGEHSTCFAILNGHEFQPSAVTETEVLLPQAALQIEDRQTLRAGKLGATILPQLPALRRLFPRGLFNIHEQKWRSRGTLRTPGGESQGWVIHEVVDWAL